MQAHTLKVGETYTVRNSAKYHDLVGTQVTIISNEVIPDGQPNQRCILVETASGKQVYLLPRLLDDGTMQVRTTGGATASSVVMPTAAPIVRRPITNPMDVRLDPYRPDPVVVRQYVSRIVGSGVKDTDLLLHYWRNRDAHGYSQNIMLVGDTQAGKTMMVQVLACLMAKELGLPKPLPVFTLSGSAGVTDFDMLGQPTAYTGEDGVERLVWLSGVVDLACRVPSILYLDEVNMMPERVTSTLHPICDDRRTFVNRAKAVCVEGEFVPEQVKVNTGTWIVGTYNPGYKGAGAMNEAFTNRFRHLPWGYDDKVESKLISSPTILLLGKALREARSLRAINTPVGTKALQRLEEDVRDLGVDTAIWVFTGLFPANEQSKVSAIISDRSIVPMLSDEMAAAGRAQAAAAAPQTNDEPF